MTNTIERTNEMTNRVEAAVNGCRALNTMSKEAADGYLSTVNPEMISSLNDNPIAWYGGEISEYNKTKVLAAVLLSSGEIGAVPECESHFCINGLGYNSEVGFVVSEYALGVAPLSDIESTDSVCGDKADKKFKEYFGRTIVAAYWPEFKETHVYVSEERLQATLEKGRKLEEDKIKRHLEFEEKRRRREEAAAI